MKFHDEFFNKIYDMIIDTYNKGAVSNGDEFLRYYSNHEDVNDVLKYINDRVGNQTYLRSIVNYEQKYFAELFFNSIKDAYDNGLISNYEDFLNYISNREDISNYYVMTLAVIADSLEDVYYDMTSVYESNKIDYAIGVDLDYIGEMIGCPRPSATRSGVLVTFSLGSVIDAVVEIDKGVLVTSKTGVVFRTLEDAVIPIGERTVDVYCESVGTGVGTRVLSNSINNIESGLDVNSINGLSVNNKESSSGGRNAYSDEEYRLLLKDWVKSKTKGTKEVFDRYFSGVHGVDGYKLIPLWNGSGTLKIVVDPGYPYQLLSIYNDIMGSVVQIDTDVTMWSPVKVPISVYIKCNVDIDRANPFSASEKEEIKSRIIDAVNTYINGDVLNSSGLGIGEDFIPYQLGLFLGNVVPEIRSLSFVKSNKVDASIVDSDGNVCVWLDTPVTISDEEIAFVDSVTVEIE